MQLRPSTEEGGVDCPKSLARFHTLAIRQLAARCHPLGSLQLARTDAYVSTRREAPRRIVPLRPRDEHGQSTDNRGTDRLETRRKDRISP